MAGVRPDTTQQLKDGEPTAVSTLFRNSIELSYNYDVDNNTIAHLNIVH